MNETTANLKPAQSRSIRAPASFAEYNTAQGSHSRCKSSLLAPPGSS